MEKFKLNAATRLLAMPRPKKEAEARVNSLAEPLYDHIFKIAVFGIDNDEFNHWSTEVASLCSRIHTVASNTEGKGNHLKDKWMFSQIFLDFFRENVFDTTLYVLRRKYPKARFQVERFTPEVADKFTRFYHKLTAQLIDKNSAFRETFFEELRAFATSFK